MKISRRFVSFALAAMMALSSVVVQPASAWIDDYMSSNNAPWYDPNFYSSSGACSGATIVGTTNIHKMWNYMVNKGLSTEAAAGVLGNIKMESGFSATRQEDSQRFPNGGWGIVQWTASRRTAIVAGLPTDLSKYHAAEYGGATSADTGYVHEGIPEEDADSLLHYQMTYLHDESIVRQTRIHSVLEGYGMTGMTEWEALKKAKSIRQASDLWLYSFERPADQSSSHAAERARYGQEIFDELISDNPGLSSGGSCMSGEVSDLQALTIDYTWPEYRRSGTSGALDIRSAYSDAVNIARTSGRYVGGIKYPGVDCGGFVTLLVTNSGFDTRYNYEGKGGNTTHQEQWTKENWTEVKPAGGGKFDVATLQPGDVAFWPGHTFIFVGEGVYPDEDGDPDVYSGPQIASASLDKRAPMAGAEDINHKDIRWYRKG